MKKGAIELTDLGEGFYRYRMLAIIDPISKKYVFSKQDLKDLRDCIDEVLGDECAVCNPEWEGKQPIPLCEEHDEEILGQPLTEGEEKLFGVDYGVEGGDKTCKIFGTVKNGKVEVTNVEFSEPQESNKEENCCGCYEIMPTEECRGECICHHEEPSKKPSERIEEIYEEYAINTKTVTEIGLRGRVIAVIQYLDELYESRKDLK